MRIFLSLIRSCWMDVMEFYCIKKKKKKKMADEIKNCRIWIDRVACAVIESSFSVVLCSLYVVQSKMKIYIQIATMHHRPESISLYSKSSSFPFLWNIKQTHKECKLYNRRIFHFLYTALSLFCVCPTPRSLAVFLLFLSVYTFSYPIHMCELTSDSYAIKMIFAWVFSLSINTHNFVIYTNKSCSSVVESMLAFNFQRERGGKGERIHKKMWMFFSALTIIPKNGFLFVSSSFFVFQSEREK